MNRLRVCSPPENIFFSTFLIIIFCVCNVSVGDTSESQKATKHLWDKSPSLYETAQSVSLSRVIPSMDPQPEGTWHGGTAANLSTPDLKLGLWGSASALTLSVGKTDVWDRRWFQEPPLPLTEITSRLERGQKYDEDYYRSWFAYDAPCPKPVGQIIIRCLDFEGADQPNAITQCSNGQTTVEITRNGTTAKLTYLPMMVKNIIAIDCHFEGVQNPVSVRLYRHQDTIRYGESMVAYSGPDPRPLEGYDYAKDKGNDPFDPPSSGTDENHFWIQQQFPPEKTFPDGFQYVMAGLIQNASISITTVDRETNLGTLPSLNPQQQEIFDGQKQLFRLLPNYQKIREAYGSAATATLPAPANGGLHFTLYVVVVTRAETEIPLDHALQQLDSTAQTGFTALADENTTWWRALYDRREKGRIFSGDPDFTEKNIPTLFRSWTEPHGGCNWPDPYQYEDSVGYWYLEQDWSPWHGLPCYNELYYTDIHVHNQSERLNYWYNLVDKWLPASRLNAQEVFGLPGGLIQHGYLPPIKADTYAHAHTVWDFCMEIPAQVLRLLWDRFDYSGDTRFLEERVYPAMRETAIFYSHYARLGEDGYYHVIPTISAEQWSWTPHMVRNRDTTSALCMFKWLLERAAEASELLDRDADLRSRWREIAGKMAPYPTYETPEGPVLTDVPGVNPIGLEYNCFAGFTPTLIADDINLDSSSEQQELMLRTARLVKGWYGPYVAPLLGAEKGIRVEQLLNSRSGRIYLFPAAPPDASVAFRDLQARGGFEVTAEWIEGKVSFARIKARRDVRCQLINPWPKQAVSIVEETSNQPVSYTVEDTGRECLSFQTQKGCTYKIDPE